MKIAIIAVMALYMCMVLNMAGCTQKEEQIKPQEIITQEQEDEPTLLPQEEEEEENLPAATPDVPVTPSDAENTTQPTLPSTPSETKQEEIIALPDAEGYDFAVNIEQFVPSLRQLIKSQDLLHGPHTLLVKGMSVPLVLHIQDGNMVIGVSAYDQEIKLENYIELDTYVSSKDVFEADGIIVISNLLVYPGGYTQIVNSGKLEDTSCYVYERDGKLIYSRYVNRLIDNYNYYAAGNYIFAADEVYSETGTVSCKDGILTFDTPFEVKTVEQVKDIEELYLRQRKTKDTTMEQWYEDNRAGYERAKNYAVDIDEAVELINTDKKLAAVKSYIGGFDNRLLFFEVNEPFRNFDVYLVSKYRGETIIEGKETLTIPGEYNYDSIRFTTKGGGGGSGETGLILALKDGEKEYYLDFYLEVSDKSVCGVIDISVFSDEHFAEMITL